MSIRTVLATLVLFAAHALHAQNAVQAGRFIVEPPTLINLGFEWDIAGDGNRNASVAVSYRKTGSSAWSDALPLLRIGGERIFRVRENLEYTVPHRFAGSILISTRYRITNAASSCPTLTGPGPATQTGHDPHTRRAATCHPVTPSTSIRPIG